VTTKAKPFIYQNNTWNLYCALYTLRYTPLFKT